MRPTVTTGLLLFGLAGFLRGQTDTTVVVSGVSAIITVDAVDPVVDWLYPDGGESFGYGGNVTGSWTTSEDSPANNPVSIFIATTPGGTFSEIITQLPDLGSITFGLPPVHTAFGRMKITIIDDFGNTGTDYSQGYFTIGNPGGASGDTTVVVSEISPPIIVDAVDPAVTLLFPTGGDSLPSGGPVNVTWTAADPSFDAAPIGIALASGIGDWFTPLTDPLANSGAESVSFPVLDTWYGRLQVTAKDTFGNVGTDVSSSYFMVGNPPTLAQDTSALFSATGADIIVDAINPLVDLLSPDGQEAILEGTGIPVTWTAVDDSLDSFPTDLSLATSIGGNFIPMADSIANDGFESVTAPTVVTDFARMRVTVRDHFGNRGVDESRDYFKIFQTGTGAITGQIRATLAAEGWLHIGLWYPGSLPESDPPDQARDSLYVTLAPGDSVPYSFANLIPGAYTVQVFLDQTGSPTGGHSYCDGAYDFTGDSSGIEVVVNTVTQNVDVDLIRCPRLFPLAPEFVYGRPRYGAIELAWRLDPEAVLYNVYRDTVSGPPLLIAQLSVPDTVFRDSNVISGRAYVYRIAAVNTLGNEGDLSAAMSIWYHPITGFWEAPAGGSAWNDDSGLNNHGTITNARDTVLNADPALWFNGLDTYVEIPDSPDLNPPEITVEALIYPTAWGGNNRILQKGLGDNQYVLEAEGDHLEFLVNDQSFSVMTPLPPVNEWMHVAGVYDGDTARIYVNYEEMNAVYVGQPLNTTNDPLYIGTKQPGSPGIDFFHGGIGKIRVANVVVPPEAFLPFDPPPSVPAQFQGQTGNNSISLSWAANPESDLDHYSLFRADTDTIPVRIADIMAPENSYLDTTVLNGVIYQYRLRAVDTAGHIGPDAVITGLRPNGPPVWSAPADTAFFEDDTLLLDLAPWIADDSDPDSTLSVAISGGVNILAANTGTLKYIFWMPPDQSGVTETFTFTVQDPWGAQVQGSISISVIPVNDAPVITNPATISATEDVELVFQPTATDVDQDPLEFQFQELPSWLYWIGNQLVGTPREGQLDTTFIEMVSDGLLGDTSIVTIRVTPVNDPPVITSPATLSATEDQPVAYWPTAVDPEDSTLTVQYLYGPDWLQFRGDSIAGAPGEGQLDTVFAFRVTDGDLFDAAVVQVQVTPVNDPPQITMPDTLVFTEHQFQFYPLLATDPEDSTLFWMILSGPSWMSIQGDSIGGTPPEGAVDSVLSLLTSDGDLSALRSLALTVIPVNDPPVLTSAISTTATEDVLYEYTASATDPEGNSVSITVLNPPVWCTVDGPSLSGVPTEGHLDTVFTVRLSDNQSVVDYPVPILVTPVNDPPVILAPDTVPVIYNQYFTYTAPVIDPEDSTLNYQFFSLASWLSSAGDSLFGMPTLAYDDTLVRLVVDDGEYVDEKIIHLDLQFADVTPQISVDLLSGEFHASIPLTVQVDAGLLTTPDSLTWTYSLDALNWLPATVTVSSGQRTLQDTFHLVWQSATDLADQYQPQVWVRTVLDPTNPAQTAVLGPIAVDNFTGRITIHDINDGQTYSGLLNIPFRIDDPSGDEHTIIADYLLVNGNDGWQHCTTPDSGLSYGPQQYFGILPWDTGLDLVNLDTLVLLALNIFDGWEIDRGDTALIRIDNQVLPMLTSSGPPELAWSDDIQLTFSKPLAPASISGGFIVNPTIGTYSGFGLELSTDERTVSIHPDTGSWAGLDTLYIRILTALEDQIGNPFDGNQNGDPDGPADELSLYITTRPIGDFDGDNAITFPDLVQFQQGWWAEAVSPEMDLGPARGVLPHLQSVMDGKIDFEDLMVFVQMWNWSESQSRTLARMQIPDQSENEHPIDFSVQYPHRKPGDPTDETELILETRSIATAGALEGYLQFDSSRLRFLSLSSTLPDGWIVLQKPLDSQIHFILADFNRNPVELNSAPCRFRFQVMQDQPAEIRWRVDLTDRSGKVLLQLSGMKSFDPLPDLPREFALRPNYPNPFNPVTRIDYNLPVDTRVKITVYNMLGREVRVLVDDQVTAGFQTTAWDGRDSNGNTVSSGVYLVSMSAGNWSAVRKIMLMK